MITLDEVEKYLQEKILPSLEKGRPTDKDHTLLVVKKLKEIVANTATLEIDLYVLIIAAYAHDWGYANLFDNTNPLSLSEIGKQKETHMNISANNLQCLLKEPFFNFLTNAQKERAVHLTQVHDKLENLRDTDELILMEADSLGGMEPDIMGVFEYKESEERFMRKSRDLRLSKFITEYGKTEFERLYKKRNDYFIKKHQLSNAAM